MSGRVGASTIRRESEAAIRAHAHHLVASRDDVLREMDVNQRARELIALAEYIVDGAPEARDLASALLPHLAVYPDKFDDLVDAVRAKCRFDSFPAAVLDDEDRPCNDRSWASKEQELARDVDVAAWDLLHPAPPCSVCRRSGPRPSWRPADWPRSLYCAEHKPVKP